MDNQKKTIRVPRRSSLGRERVTNDGLSHRANAVDSEAYLGGISRMKIIGPPRSSSIKSNENQLNSSLDRANTISRTGPINAGSNGNTKAPIANSIPKSHLAVPEQQYQDVDTLQSSPSFTNPSPKTMSVMLSDLESKSRAELLSIAKKLGSEIHTKNRIIYDKITDEKWLIAELGQISNRKPTEKKYRISELAQAVNNFRASSQDTMIFETLASFKNELDAAKEALEQKQSSLLILEKKRSAAEEEAAHLRSILDSNKLNISEAQSKRITELEDQLQETLNNYASLQTKISQWARASKRNQEGRIAAESVQNILEQDVKTLEQQLAESIQAETAARLKFENLNDLLKTAGDDGNIPALKASLMHAQSRITELEARVNHSNEPKQNAEKRSSKMNILFDQEVKEKMKYQKLVETYEKKNQELMEEYASISRSNSLKSIEDPQKKSKEVPKRVLEHELEAMRERFAALQAEYEDLVKTHNSALDTLEETETKVADLENTIFQNGDLVQRLNVLAIEKKTLQTALDNYERKDQTKQLAIEMLESHIAKAKAKLAPLEKAAEDLEEMKYTLDEERNAKEALEEKSKILSEQCEKYRVELMEYAKTNREPLISESDKYKYQKDIDSLQIANRNLREQLDDQIRAFKALQNRFDTKVSEGLPADMLSVQNQSNSVEEQLSAVQLQKEVNSLTSELHMTTATLAQQQILMNKMEVELGTSFEKIEGLEGEKVRLNQKLVLMQRIKSDFDAQTVQLEKAQARIIELESLMSTENKTDQEAADAKQNNSKVSKILHEIMLEIKSLFIDISEQEADSQLKLIESEDEYIQCHYYLEGLRSIFDRRALELLELERKLNDATEKEIAGARGEFHPDAYDKQIADLNAKVEEYARQLESVNAAPTSKESISLEKYHELEKKLVQLQIENENQEDIQEELKKTLERMKRMESAIVEYQSAVKLLQEELSDAEHETAEYTEREEVLRQKIEQIKAENQISLEELRTHNNQVQENLLKEIQDLKSQSINAGENAHSNVEDEKKYKDLINEIEFYKTEIEILRDQIEALEKSRFELEEAVEYQGGIAEDALQQVDEYEEELLYLRSMRDKFESFEIQRPSLAESQQKPPTLNLKKSNIQDLYQ